MTAPAAVRRREVDDPGRARGEHRAFADADHQPREHQPGHAERQEQQGAAERP